MKRNRPTFRQYKANLARSIREKIPNLVDIRGYNGIDDGVCLLLNSTEKAIVKAYLRPVSPHRSHLFSSFWLATDQLESSPESYRNVDDYRRLSQRIIAMESLAQLVGTLTRKEIREACHSYGIEYCNMP